MYVKSQVLESCRMFLKMSSIIISHLQLRNELILNVYVPSRMNSDTVLPAPTRTLCVFGRGRESERESVLKENM